MLTRIPMPHAPGGPVGVAAPEPTAPYRPLLVATSMALWAFAALRLESDTDLWGHVRFGLDILRTGSLPSVDPFSFTSDVPWVNHEWVAEAAMGAAWLLGAGAGLVALKVAIVTGACALTWLACRRAAGPDAAWAGAAIVAFGSLYRTEHMRPQVFGLLACACLVLALRSTPRWPTWRSAVAIAAVIAVWANVHGSWFVGAAIVVAWCIGRTWAGTAAWRVVPLAAAAALGSLLTPYGTTYWSFLADTVHISRPEITDWAPVWHEPGLVMIWMGLAGAGAYAWHTAIDRRALAPWLAPWVVTGVAAFRLARVDLFFGCITASLLAESLSQRGTPAPAPAGSRDHRARVAIACLAAALILLPWARRLAEPVRCIAVPAGYPEVEAADALNAEPAPQRILTYFDYGEFAIWHLAPRHRISMDGRRETVYSAALVEDHFSFYLAPDAHADYPDRLGATAVWVPSDVKFSAALAPRGWAPVFVGPASTVWMRGHVSPARSRSFTAKRCFPR